MKWVLFRPNIVVDFGFTIQTIKSKLLDKFIDSKCSNTGYRGVSVCREDTDYGQRDTVRAIAGLLLPTFRKENIAHSADFFKCLL